MRLYELNTVTESMSFHAYKKNPGDTYFSMVTGDADRYKDEVYKTDFDEIQRTFLIQITNLNMILIYPILTQEKCLMH